MKRKDVVGGKSINDAKCFADGKGVREMQAVVGEFYCHGRDGNVGVQCDVVPCVDFNSPSEKDGSVQHGGTRIGGGAD